MAQLIINDLDFCQTEVSELKGGWLRMDVAIDVAAFASPPYGIGYAQVYGIALAIGNQADGTAPDAAVNVNAGGVKQPAIPLPFSFG